MCTIAIVNSNLNKNLNLLKKEILPIFPGTKCYYTYMMLYEHLGHSSQNVDFYLLCGLGGLLILSNNPKNPKTLYPINIWLRMKFLVSLKYL